MILFPEKTSPYKADPKSMEFNPDPSYKSLTFKAKSHVTELIITQQATPENFTDIPQLYDKTVEAMKPYGSIDTKQGKVTLTTPDKSNNNQVAVMNNHGTLVFVRSEKDLDNDQWRQFFNGLQLITPK